MITGSIVAMATPMFPDGNIDWTALDRLVDFHAAAGSDALVAVGTTGESSTLDDGEHISVIARVVERAAGRLKVIGGTGSNSTREAMQLTREAAEVGVDACLLVTPYYNKPTQQGLYEHYRVIAEAVDVPQILYNVPGRTAIDLKNDTVARLIEVENIVGIKDATGDLERGRELLALCSENFAVYSGDDATAIEFMLLGAKGNVSVTANVCPKEMRDACAAALTGNASEARRLDAQMVELHDLLFTEANPIPVKWALHKMGLIDIGIRLPLTALAEEHHGTLLAALQRAGVIRD